MKHKLTITLVCDSLRERVCEWRKKRDTRTNRPKGVFATFRDRPNGARFVQLFPQYAGQTLTFTVGQAFAVPPAVGEWLFANGYLEPVKPQALWR